MIEENQRRLATFVICIALASALMGTAIGIVVSEYIGENTWKAAFWLSILGALIANFAPRPK